MKILFLVPYPIGRAPSQRFRFEQYFDSLKKRGYSFDIQSFITEKTWQILYQKGYFFHKIIGILQGFLRRFWVLFRLHQYDIVFLHREATPIGFPIIEFLITQIFRKKIIFDFDDAIWLPNTSQQNKIVAWLKWHQKTAYICKKAHKISAGNLFLAQYAQQFSQNVVLNPTTIDTVKHHCVVPKVKTQDKIIIGWTGTHSTMKYLPDVLPVLDKIVRQKPIEFRIISNQLPDFQRDYIQFIRWTKDHEIQDLASFDIGIMPLTDDIWAQGKCGFKALQYMALNIPPLASPVGVNTQIIENGKTGFLCQTPQDWEKNIVQLIDNQELRIKIGRQARQKVETQYSVTANVANFLKLFDVS